MTPKSLAPYIAGPTRVSKSESFALTDTNDTHFRRAVEDQCMTSLKEALCRDSCQAHKNNDCVKFGNEDEMETRHELLRVRQ
jgi:hypothetical protein